MTFLESLQLFRDGSRHCFLCDMHGLLNDASYDQALELCTKYIKVGTLFDASLKRLVDESFVSQYTSTDESTIWWDGK